MSKTSFSHNIRDTPTVVIKAQDSLHLRISDSISVCRNSVQCECILWIICFPPLSSTVARYFYSFHFTNYLNSSRCRRLKMWSFLLAPTSREKLVWVTCSRTRTKKFGILFSWFSGNLSWEEDPESIGMFSTLKDVMRAKNTGGIDDQSFFPALDLSLPNLKPPPQQLIGLMQKKKRSSLRALPKPIFKDATLWVKSEKENNPRHWTTGRQIKKKCTKSSWHSSINVTIV